MVPNRIHFQPGMSMPDFIAQYGGVCQRSSPIFSRHFLSREAF